MADGAATPSPSCPTLLRTHHYGNQQANQEDTTGCAHYDRQEGLQVLNQRQQWQKVDVLLGILQRVDDQLVFRTLPLFVVRDEEDAVLGARLEFTEQEPRCSRGESKTNQRSG